MSTKRNTLLSGRKWWRIKRREVRTEWYFAHKARSSLSAYYRRGRRTEGREWHIAIPFLFSVFLSVNAWSIENKDDRELYFAFHDGIVWITVWEHPDNWSKGDRRYVLNWRDWLLGKQVYTDDVVKEGDAEVILPEGEYTAHYIESVSQWSRARGRAVSERRYQLDFGSRPIPLPGKGDNEWDMGEDALYATMFPAESLREAVDSVIDDILQTRLKYGGANWKPGD